MILYKYFSDETGCCSIKEGRMVDGRQWGGLYAKLPSELNDPFECLDVPDRELTRMNMAEAVHADDHGGILEYSFDDIGILVRGEAGNGLIDELTDVSIRRYLQSAADGKFRITSFSADPLNVLMWSYYGASHEGVVIGYDEQIAARWRNHLRQVSYIHSPVRYGVSLRDDRRFLESYEELHFSKSAIWSHEREWRVIVDQDQLRCTNKRYFLDVDPLLVREVIFGVNCKESVRDAYICAIRSVGAENVTFYQATKTQSGFLLEKRLLEH